MKRKINALSLCAFLAISSCVNSQSSGNPELKTYNITGFSSIRLNVPGTIKLNKGDFQVSIKTSPSLLEKIQVEKHGNELVIKLEHSGNMHANEPINIEISLPALSGLEVNGSGSISSKSSFTSNALNLQINGSGEINLPNLTAQKIKAEVNGSGHIDNLSGQVKEVTFEINGSGKIRAENLEAKTVNAEVTGSGTIRLNASETLNAEITGSGDISYRGTPVSKNVDITGSGSVKSL